VCAQPELEKFLEANIVSIIDSFEKMLDAGQDTALLRYSLGTAYQKAGDLPAAAHHLAEAVEQDPGYSAAWKAYGRVLVEQNRLEEAVSVFEKGIAVAERKGDIQAAREMKVFMKRATKRLSELEA
jgi:tetratricopeptide (TPR) repeat protein